MFIISVRHFQFSFNLIRGGDTLFDMMRGRVGTSTCSSSCIIVIITGYTQFVVAWMLCIFNYNFLIFVFSMFNVHVQCSVLMYGAVAELRYSRTASCFCRITDSAKCHTHIVRIKVERANCACIFYGLCAPFRDSNTYVHCAWYMVRKIVPHNVRAQDRSELARQCAYARKNWLDEFIYIYLFKFETETKQNWRNCVAVAVASAVAASAGE